MRRHVPILVAAFVLFAGCAGFPVTTTTQPTQTEEGTAKVLEVVDGDTIRVQYEGRTDTVRLVGVDSPETHAANTPAEFPGVPTTEAGRNCLRGWGKNATEFAKQELAGKTVRLTFDPQTDHRDRYGRLLAYVQAEGEAETFNYRLVAEGYARVYESDFTNIERYRAAAADAREANRGLWACTVEPTTEVVVDAVHADAAGRDGDNLNDEYLVLRNPGNESVSLGGWTVHDEAGHTYTFPDGVTLAPGETLTLHSGSGQDGDGDYYWDASGPIWNNDGDTVTVADASGGIVVTYAYGSHADLRPPHQPGHV